MIFIFGFFRFSYVPDCLFSDVASALEVSCWNVARILITGPWIGGVVINGSPSELVVSGVWIFSANHLELSVLLNAFCAFHFHIGWWAHIGSCTEHFRVVGLLIADGTYTVDSEVVLGCLFQFIHSILSLHGCECSKQISQLSVRVHLNVEVVSADCGPSQINVFASNFRNWVVRWGIRCSVTHFARVVAVFWRSFEAALHREAVIH